MAIKLPTNLNLPAPAFLDLRVGLAKTVSDLRNWDFTAYPIPVGFEVCVEGKWYSYQGQDEGIVVDTITGYFRERGGINVTQDIGTSTTDVMSQAAVTNALYSLNDLIQQLVEKVGVIFEIKKVDILNSDGTVATNGGELYEKGKSIIPYFAWKSYYNGDEVLPGNENEGNNTYNVEISYIEYIDGEWSAPKAAQGSIIFPVSGDEDKYITKFQGNSINKDTIFTVTLKYGSGVNQLSASLEVPYTFVDRKYWGYTNNSDISTSDILEKFLDEENSTDAEGNKLINKVINSELSLSRELPLMTIDCTEADEGVYPIYIIPSDIWNSEGNDKIRIQVGNIDVNTYDLKIGTVQNGTINYHVILFNVKQRGILDIEVKNYE